MTTESVGKVEMKEFIKVRKVYLGWGQSFAETPRHQQGYCSLLYAAAPPGGMNDVGHLVLVELITLVFYD